MQFHNTPIKINLGRGYTERFKKLAVFHAIFFSGYTDWKRSEKA